VPQGSRVVRIPLLLLAALLLGAAVSGCLGNGKREAAPAPLPSADRLSQPRFTIKDPEELWVAASDGKRMDVAVYRPATEEKVPVFVNFSPYWGDSAMAKGDAFSQYMVEEYVPRGFAVALAAVRGTGHSEGCFQLGGDRELQDLQEVVDALAAQPWSTGAVAAGGKSYDSTSQNGMVAKFPSQHLKGIFHVSGITDMYRYNYYGGVPYETGPIFNTYYYGQGIHEYGLPVPLVGGSPPDAGDPSNEGPDSLARLVDDVACTELPKEQASGAGSGASGQKDAYWQERDWTRSIAQSQWNGSIFFVHGFQDWNVKPDNMVPWLSNLPPQVKAHTLGWLHQWQQDGTGHVYPMRTDWNETLLRWLDYTLKGKDTGMDSLWGFELQAMGEEGHQVWRRVRDWPPAAEVLAEIPAGGQADVRMANETHLTGPAWAEVAATVTDPQAVLSLRLEKSDGTFVSEGVLRALYRNGLDSPSVVSPGEQTLFRVDLYPFDLEMKPGESLRLVSGATPTQTVATPAELAAVDYRGATLHLPYAPDAKVLDAQPVQMRCFTC
jgi:X-Pro dipeptidyl-peptidase